jgi:ABC-type branched-subunit amino acid transport system substrate-binding protein
MAKKAATFAKDKFQNRQMAIFYGASRNDSLMAQYYRQALEQEGFSTFVCQKFSPEINIDLVGRKVGHVFLANYDRKLGQALITYLDRKKVTSPLVALADAFNTEIFSAGMFNGRDYYFIDPDFVEKGKTDTEAFQKNYFNKYNALPSNYAFLGYDMMLFWGRILQKYGYNKVQTGLSIKKYDEGFTTQGFDYRDHNDNQSVPILHYDNYKLVVVAK